jgi:hypothetical protein
MESRGGRFGFTSRPFGSGASSTGGAMPSTSLPLLPLLPPLPPWTVPVPSCGLGSGPTSESARGPWGPNHFFPPFLVFPVFSCSKKNGRNIVTASHMEARTWFRVIEKKWLSARPVLSLHPIHTPVAPQPVPPRRGGGSGGKLRCGLARPPGPFLLVQRGVIARCGAVRVARAMGGNGVEWGVGGGE